jgi:hypothetical protein
MKLPYGKENNRVKTQTLLIIHSPEPQYPELKNVTSEEIVHSINGNKNLNRHFLKEVQWPIIT